MVFKSKSDLKSYLKENCVFINFGSRGSAYFDKKLKIVIKVFDMALSENDYRYFEYKGLDFLRFSNALNSTYLFPYENVILDGRVIGYLSHVGKGKSLYKLDPLIVNLDSIKSAYSKALIDLRIISKKGILTDDLPYNTLFSIEMGKFYVVDTDDYHLVDSDEKSIYDDNVSQLSYTVKTFLVDGYFDDFIKSDKELSELYQSGDLLSFLKIYRKKLSEKVGKSITTLSEASEIQDEEHWREYMRVL